MAQLLNVALDFVLHDHVFARLDIQEDESCSASVLRKYSDANGHLLVYITEHLVQLFRSEHTVRVLLSLEVNPTL